MRENKKLHFPSRNQQTNSYDDGNIPSIDLPQDIFPENVTIKAFPEEPPIPTLPPEFPMNTPQDEFPAYSSPAEVPTDVIPDEVPRRDGPGGEDTDSSFEQKWNFL